MWGHLLKLLRKWSLLQFAWESLFTRVWWSCRSAAATVCCLEPLPLCSLGRCFLYTMSCMVLPLASLTYLESRLATLADYCIALYCLHPLPCLQVCAWSIASAVNAFARQCGACIFSPPQYQVPAGQFSFVSLKYLRNSRFCCSTKPQHICVLFRIVWDAGFHRFAFVFCFSINGRSIVWCSSN